MFVVDTNVLLDAANQDSPHHEACRSFLENARRQSLPWYVTWNIVYEFLRVSTHPRVYRYPWTPSQAWQFLEALLAAPSAGLLVAGPGHQAVLAQVFSELPQLRGNVVHDAHTAVLMREHGIHRVITRDTDFYRFPFLTVANPEN